MPKKTDISRYTDENRDKKTVGRRSNGWRIVGKTLSILLKVILSVLFVAFVTGLIVGVSMFIYIMGFVDTKADVDLLSLKQNLTSFVYVNNAEGVPVEYQRLYSVENRVNVDFKDIPIDMRNAIIAIEDQRFEKHNGVDWTRTGAAVLNLFGLYGGDSSFGGSTITQQLIKNITGENDVSLNRKIKEIFSALNLEKEYTKEQVLDAYLNTIGLANGCNGVQVAANRYFGKNISECSLAECASLAGITQNPSKWNPLRYPENNRIRTKIVLTAMYNQEIISEQRYKAAYAQAENLQFKQKEEEDNTPVQNWYMDLTMTDLINDLMDQEGLSKAEGTAKVYQGGLHIFSAMDPEFQTHCEDFFKYDADVMPADQTMQSSLFMMDYSGRVLATVGSRLEKTANRLFNRSVSALRQPGSSIKPLGVYAPAMEAGLINYSSMMNDTPFDEEKQWPKNHYRSYNGDMIFSLALARSSNATAVWTLSELTPQRGFDFITQKLNFTTPHISYEGSDGKNYSDIDYAPLAVGGFTEGVTAKEMCAGFQIFGNGGKYYEPYTYYYVRDSEKNIVLDNRGKTPVQAISKENAAIMNKLLQGVIYSPVGTGGAASISGWTIFGKTGTTTSNYDRWFVGGSPYAVAAVWTGYDRPQKIEGSRNLSVPIWRAIMSHYLQGKEEKTYERPSNVITRQYCKTTGFLAAPGICLETDTGWYTANNMPKTCDGNHPGAASSEVSEADEITPMPSFSIPSVDSHGSESTAEPEPEPEPDPSPVSELPETEE